MAGKKGMMRMRHQDDVRKKIGVSQILNRLEKHVNGELDPELSPTQVQAAKILLDKAISNAPTEISGPDGGPIMVSGTLEDEQT